ncbi:hypothetical protein ACFQZC_35390 [Streptacidiphilus monticola]
MTHSTNLDPTPDQKTIDAEMAAVRPDGSAHPPAPTPPTAAACCGTPRSRSSWSRTRRRWSCPGRCSASPTSPTSTAT